MVKKALVRDSSEASGVPSGLVALHAKLAKKIDGKYCHGLPHYSSDSKLPVALVDLGDRDLFEVNDVDSDEWPGWIPFASLDDEPQFLAIQTKAPYPVGMWEHEDGKIHPVWASLDKFAASLLASKKQKTPYELLDVALDKADRLIDAKKYPAALKELEAAIKPLPTIEPTRRDDQLQRLNNLLGLALKGCGRRDEAMEAFERASRAGDEYAALNIISMLLTDQKSKQALARALKLRAEGWANAYVRSFIAIYIAWAQLDLGNGKAAEKELRAIVTEFAVSDAERVTKAREKIEEYIQEKRPGAKLAAPFLAWLAPKAYEVAAADAKGNRTWWTKLPPGMREKLFEEVKLKGDADQATDDQIARCLDTEECDLDEDEDHPIKDLTPFLRLTNLRRLSFYGDPDSIEPLRALAKLERLTINNVVIKDFRWFSRAQRDLWKAAAAGNKKGMEKALAAGAEINARSHDFGNAAIHLVDGESLVLWLIERGADPYAGNHGDGDSVIEYWDEAKKEKAYAAMKKAGIPRIEDEPYRELSVKRMERGATFAEPSVKIKDKYLDDGDSLASKWPKNVTLKMEAPKKDNKVHDVMRAGYRSAVVSEKVADVLRADRNVELLVVKLLDHGGKPVPGAWFFLNPLEKDCLVIERCYPAWSHINPDTASEVCAYVIDPTRVGGAQLFRPGVLSGRPMIATRQLADMLAGFSGVRISHLTR